MANLRSLANVRKSLVFPVESDGAAIQRVAFTEGGKSGARSDAELDLTTRFAGTGRYADAGSLGNERLGGSPAV